MTVRHRLQVPPLTQHRAHHDPTSTMSYTFASATVLLLIIADPVGNIPIFLHALRNVAPARRPHVIVREVLIAFGVLLLFLWFGASFLQLLHLSSTSLQMAGAVVLFLMALRMVFPDTGPQHQEPPGEPLIVPLAIPSLAGPSAIATVMLLVAQEPDRQWEWAGALAVTMVICCVVLLMSEHIQRWAGDRVMAAFERLMGLLLLAMAVEMFTSALRQIMHP